MNRTNILIKDHETKEIEVSEIPDGSWFEFSSAWYSSAIAIRINAIRPLLNDGSKKIGCVIVYPDGDNRDDRIIFIDRDKKVRPIKSAQITIEYQQETRDENKN